MLLDLTMPGPGGEEVLRRSKSSTPEAKVVLSSGYNEVEVIQRFTGKGLAGFLQKPYTSAALVDKINRVLNGDHFLAWSKSMMRSRRAIMPSISSSVR